MSDLLEQAIDAVKRLPPQRQENVALAMLALASDDGAAHLDFELPGGVPAEAQIIALMPTVMPSAVPTKAEVEAWNRLSPGEQLERMRAHLTHPDCSKPSPHSMADILAIARQRAAARRHG